ncbi:MAG: glycosyltransferase family 4 protein, partial [Candidatus Riflebacteria bacterium]|nr:glycosyltransferase family 4 protein [Candidatus Riflebacteria bacterium]
LIEAMVLGTLAVSADCPDGPREIMMDGKCGLLFEPGNQEQLADIMENIASGKIDKAEYVKAASKNLERFNIDNTVKVAEETLLKIAAE